MMTRPRSLKNYISASAVLPLTLCILQAEFEDDHGSIEPPAKWPCLPGSRRSLKELLKLKCQFDTLDEIESGPAPTSADVGGKGRSSRGLAFLLSNTNVSFKVVKSIIAFSARVGFPVWHFY